VQTSPVEPSRYTVRYPGTLPPGDSVLPSDRAFGLRKNVRVVIVDDDPFFRSLLKVMLTQSGLQNAQIEEAEDSDRALGVCRKGPVDLVFCDLNLPAFRSMNGLEIIRELRHLSPSVPIYMVTADNTQDLIEKVRAVGATGHILKPVSLRTLKRLLLSNFGSSLN
jgi:two-component system response regulator YesN